MNADSILALTVTRTGLHSVEEALPAGIGSASTFTIDSTIALIELCKKSNILASMTKEQADVMLAEHRHFLFPMTQWGFPQFSVLDSLLSVERPLVKKTLLAMSPSESVDQTLLTFARGFNLEYFRTVMSKPVDGIVVPTLDFNLKRFTAEDLTRLSHHSRPLGCPAMEVNAEFVPWLIDTIKRIAVYPILQVSQG